MIILDTCALVYDALIPKKLSAKATKIINSVAEKKQLCCSDISLWEIGMLIQKKRIDPGTDTQNFLSLMLQSRQIHVIPISAEIAALATTDIRFNHFDPADRIIAATALYHQADLITCDQHLKNLPEISIIW
jgi:PIN domain nuclease of toxin-antitoxin system